MHSRHARAKRECEDRLHVLTVWRGSPLCTDRKRAALAWDEALTLLSETHTPDDAYQEMRLFFSDEETVNLTPLIGLINLWNRRRSTREELEAALKQAGLGD